MLKMTHSAVLMLNCVSTMSTSKNTTTCLDSQNMHKCAEKIPVQAACKVFRMWLSLRMS